MRERSVSIWVGLLVVLAIGSAIFLSVYVSAQQFDRSEKMITLTAEFTDVASLQVRAPVRIAGVKIGYVKSITLNPQTYLAHVAIRVDEGLAKIPEDSKIKVSTEGVLGSNFLSIMPGMSERYLSNKMEIADAEPALQHAKC